MRFSSISSSLMNEKERGHVDHLENSGQANDNVINEEAPSEAWLRSEKRIVRKLDMTLLPTVWTLYLFKWVHWCLHDVLAMRKLTTLQLLRSEQHCVRPLHRQFKQKTSLTCDQRQARLNSFEEDLGLTGNDFSVAVSILSVGSVLPYDFVNE